MTDSTSQNSTFSDVNFDNTEVAFAHKSNYDLRKQYLLFASMNKPWLVGTGTKLVKTGLELNLPIKKLIKKTLFDQFCGGETITDCESTIELLGNSNIGTILDYSVEGAETEKWFDHTEQEIIATIHKAATSAHIPFSVFKVTGLCKSELLIKVQAGKALSETEKAAFETLRQRVDNICSTAFQKGVRIFMDAEETWLQEPIDRLAMEMMEKYNQEGVIVYNTYQIYLHEKLGQIKRDFATAAQKGFLMGAKIVRGAYLEKERLRAKELGYPDPTQPNKKACDDDYNAALKFCVANKEQIAICAGSHNEASSHYLTQLMHELDVPNGDPHIFFAQLYGMSDHISFNLSAKGYNVAKYVPYGPVKQVLPYLFRRAEENTSISGQSSREYNLVVKELKRRKVAL